MRVLVVDDDEILLRATAATLRLAGFDVLAAQSGESALELAAGAMPDAVLIDLMMPRMNGIELIRTLRARHAPMRVVLTSSFPLSDRQIERMGLSNVEFVAKPASLEELSAALRGTGSIVPSAPTDARPASVSTRSPGAEVLTGSAGKH